MKERPILFSTPMVQGILERRKTMTRRGKNLDSINELQNTCKIKFTGVKGEFKGKPIANFQAVDFEAYWGYTCPYGKPGDILWVRESFGRFYDEDGPYIGYKADDLGDDFKFKPSIHMPKDAARIWLMITNVRVERLDDISEEDAKAEGVLEYQDGYFKNYFKAKGLRESDGVECLLAKGSFQSLWSSINGIESLMSNPWVWVIEFDVLSTTGRPNDLAVCSSPETVNG